MTVRKDRCGLPLTATAPDAVEALDRAIEDYLAMGVSVPAHLEAALAADPGMPLAQAMRGFLLLSRGVAPGQGEARRIHEELADRATRLTARERGYIAALGVSCTGDAALAGDILEEILVAFPRDALALRLVHLNHFYRGSSLRLRDSVARAMRSWDPTVPNWGYVLGMRAFGLEETGAYGPAEEAAREAVSLNPRDAWAVHAASHVMEMQDRRAEGIAWIREREPHWRECNNFRYHIKWHEALMRLDLGQCDEILAEYDDGLRDAASVENIDIANDVSLLLRLEFEGVDVGDRWHDIADKVRARAEEPLHPFFAVHFLIAFAAAGDGAAVETLLAAQRRIADRASGPMVRVLTEIALPLCEAVIAHREAGPGEAVPRLMPLRYELHRIGGSHAQRDLFAALLIEAARASGAFDLAAALLAERLAQRPGNLWGLRRLEDVCRRLGDQAAASAVAARIEARLATEAEAAA